MLTVSNDHFVFSSLQSTELEPIDYLIEKEALNEELETTNEESDYESKLQILAELIPCRNTRLCLLRLFEGQMTCSQLAEYWGMHRSNVGRLVKKVIQKLHVE